MGIVWIWNIFESGLIKKRLSLRWFSRHGISEGQSVCGKHSWFRRIEFLKFRDRFVVPPRVQQGQSLPPLRPFERWLQVTTVRTLIESSHDWINVDGGSVGVEGCERFETFEAF